MDLRIADIAASPAEREAVDAFLDRRIGSARGGWDGGERDVAADGRVAYGGHDARSHRDLLLPSLHAVQDRVGWISPGAVAHIARRLLLPRLRWIGADLDAGTAATLDLRELERVHGNLNAANARLFNLPQLQSVGGYLFAPQRVLH